jgi:hypothetical protein
MRQTERERRLHSQRGAYAAKLPPIARHTADGSGLTPDEIEFGRAMETFRRTKGVRFPTCSQVLAVLRSLGYAKCSQPE